MTRADRFSLIEGCNRKSGGWCQVMLDGRDILHLNRQQRALGNVKSIGWNIARNKKIGAESASVDVKVRTLPTRQMFETLGRNLEGEFLADFTYHALKVGFIPFAVPPEKSHFPGMDDAGDIVPLLQQEATLGIDNYCSGDLPVPRSAHVSSSSLIVWRGQQLVELNFQTHVAGLTARLRSKRQKDRFDKRIKHVIQQSEFFYLT
jgi:hypothetical protein